jgi:hypothetical protein
MYKSRVFKFAANLTFIYNSPIIDLRGKTMKDKHIRTIAAFEQVGAFLNIFANFLYSYHKDLVKAGFQRDEALKLVRELQATIFKESFNSSASPENNDIENDEE